MAKVATPVFMQDLRYGPVTISTANTNRDGSGTLGTVLTADATDGTLIDHIDIQAIGTTTAGMVRLYIHNNTTAFLWREVPITAITPSATVAAFFHTIDCTVPRNSLYLPPLHSLRASTHNAESFNIHAFAGDL